MIDVKGYLKYISLVALGIVILVLTHRFLELEVESLVALYSGQIYTAAVIILVLYMIKPLIWTIPQAVLCIAAGFLFPLGWAIAITVLGNLFELSIGYFIGRRWGRERVDALVAKRKGTQKFFGQDVQIKPSLCLIAGLLPLPKAIVSMFFGASSLQYKQFILFCMIGNVPAAALYVFIGNTLLLPILT